MQAAQTRAQVHATKCRPREGFYRRGAHASHHTPVITQSLQGCATVATECVPWLPHAERPHLKLSLEPTQLRAAARLGAEG
eukprot:7066553-Prymnesium_polylepis.2